MKLKEHWTLLIVTHDPSELITIADSCWSIQKGHLKPINPDSLTIKKSRINFDLLTV